MIRINNLRLSPNYKEDELVKKIVKELNCKKDEIVRIESSDLNGLPAMISSMKALSIMRKVCEAYFAYVINSKVTEKKVEPCMLLVNSLMCFLKNF